MSACRAIAETLDFRGRRHIVSDIGTIAINQLNEACERVLKSVARSRFVIDMTSPEA